MYVSNAVITVILCVMAAFALNRIIEIPAERLRIALTQYLRPPRSPATGDMPTPARTDAA
jgi:hypothetical protein